MIWRFLRSKGLALFLLIILAILCLTGGWLKWVRPEIDIFTSPVFLITIVLFFLNTFACTIQRTGFVLLLLKGKIPENSLVFPLRDISFEGFLIERGFKCTSKPYVKNRLALIKGWLFHVGILVMLTGIFVQQALYEEGTFDITVGQTLRLPQDTIERKKGLLRKDNSYLEVTLLDFDPFYYEKGYARDRLSRLIINYSGKVKPVSLTRVKGADIDSLTIYQGIPHGLSLIMEIEGRGIYTFFLRDVSERMARAEFSDPEGKRASFSMTTENPINDPKGIGDFRLYYERNGNIVQIFMNKDFEFGGLKARLKEIRRWSRFTYAINPGMPLVFIGFLIAVVGSIVFLFQGGIAMPDESGKVAGYVYVTRGGEVMLNEWLSRGDNGI